jgi:hypothetical protein
MFFRKCISFAPFRGVEVLHGDVFATCFTVLYELVVVLFRFVILSLVSSHTFFFNPVRSASRRLADVQTCSRGILPAFQSPTSSAPFAGWMLPPRPLISPPRPLISPPRRQQLSGYQRMRSSSRRRLTDVIRQWCPEKAARSAIWTPFPLILCSKLRSR